MNDRIEAALAPTYRLLRRLRRRARLVRWSAHNQRELKRLRANGDERSMQLAGALADAIADRLLPEERSRIAELERTRGILERSRHALRRSPGAYPRRPAGFNWPSIVTAGRAARYASVHAAWGRLLLSLIRATRPSYALELGTAIGISTAYLGTALAARGSGRVVTFEADEDLAGHARSLFASLQLANIEQRVEWITEDALGAVCRSNGPFEFVFADAIKDGDVLLNLHRRLAALAAPGAIIAYDDVDWSAELVETWAAIRNEPSVALSIDVGRLGIVAVNQPQVENVRLSFHVC